MSDIDLDELSQSLFAYSSVCAGLIRDVGHQTPLSKPVETEPQWHVGCIALKRFFAVERLGAGADGEVWCLKSSSSQELFSVKRLRFSSAGSHQKSRHQSLRLARELIHWIDLPNHQNLSQCLSFETASDEVFIFSEYVDGGSLQDWILDRRLYNGGPRVALERIFQVAIGTAWGLFVADEYKNLVHQDVKPGNILIQTTGTDAIIPKLSDFGMASDFFSATPRFRWNVRGFTRQWRSPEQASAQPVDEKTDIWSWALCVLDMLTGAAGGKPPWKNRRGEHARRHLELALQKSIEPNQLKIPHRLAELLHWCFRGKAQDRPWRELLLNQLGGIYEEEFARPYPHELADGVSSTRLERIREKEAAAARIGIPFHAGLFLLQSLKLRLFNDASSSLLGHSHHEPLSLLSFFAEESQQTLPALFQRSNDITGPARFEVRKQIAEMHVIQGELHLVAGDQKGAELAWKIAIQLYQQIRLTPGYGETSFASLEPGAEILLSFQMRFEVEYSYSQLLRSIADLLDNQGRTAEAEASRSHASSLLRPAAISGAEEIKYIHILGWP